MIEITAYKTPKIIFISHVCTGTMTQEALKAQIQQLEQERDTLLIELQTASLELQRAPDAVNQGATDTLHSKCTARKKRDAERMEAFNMKKKEEAKRREEEAREREQGKGQKEELLKEIIDALWLLHESHRRDREMIYSLQDGIDELHEKLNRVLYGYDCQGKDLRKNDESTAADPAPVDV